MQSVVLNIFLLSSECHYAEYHYAECCYAERRDALWIEW